MKRAIAWFAENGVAANLLMLLLVAGGLLSLPHIKMEIVPEISPDCITIAGFYPGAAPQEVEKAVCVRIEEEIQDLEEIKHLTSTASEGVGTVTVEMMPGASARKLLEDIKARVDTIDTFPDETERPIITAVTLRSQVINVAISGNADEVTLRHLGEHVRDEVAALPGISQVELANVRPYEVSIAVSEAALRRHGLTFDAVVHAVRQASLDLPGGSLKAAGGEILLRIEGQAHRGPDFEDIILLSRPDGTRLRVGDVAQVVDGFDESNNWTRFNGRAAVLVRVLRVGEQNVLQVAQAVRAYVREAQARMPKGITLSTWQDSSVYLRSRLDLLLDNALSGLMLVFTILALFLKVRLAFWVSLGIPVSFLGTLWLMPSLDVSINMISLFAFIIVLGIVVDDAIVIVLPAHLSHSKPQHPQIPPQIPRRGFWGVWGLLQRAFAAGLERFVECVYRPSIECSLRWRYLTVTAFLATLILTVGLVGGSWIRFVFFPSVEPDHIAAELIMPWGTPIEVTANAAQRLEQAALKLRAELDAEERTTGKGALRHVLASVNEQLNQTSS